MEQEVTEISLPAQWVNEIANYLGTKPYVEVAHLIDYLGAAARQAQQQQNVPVPGLNNGIEEPSKEEETDTK